VSAPHSLADWQRPEYAKAWHDDDVLRDLLAFPRRMSAALVGYDTTPSVVVDIGSGPGAFLEVFLDAFPAARGVWTDGSAAMRELATGPLTRFGDRIDYHITEMTDLSGIGQPHTADVVLTSRASHHLDPDGLATFYAAVAGRLRTGGWIVNLDHIGPTDDWNRRYRAVRGQFTGRRRNGEGHQHRFPPPSVDQHLRALTGAGFEDVDIAWKAFGTVLLMGRTR
jgi:trans-aconitate methyltransferase